MLNNNSKQPFYLGDWCVIPEQCQLQNNQDIKHIQPKLMEVLLYLSDHQQQVMSTDDLIQACWAGQPMTDNPIHKTIAQLRKALGDSSEIPKYIKTIPRKGYMMIAKVSKGVEKRQQQTPFWRDQAPFLGLQSFQQHHKDIFFARDQSIADFLKFIERINRTDSLLIFLSGMSGCGKSSFIQAGIIPKLLNPYKPFKLKFVDSVVLQVEKDSDAIDLLTTLHLKGVFDERLSIESLVSLWKQQPSTLADLIKTEHEPNTRTVIFIDQLEKSLISEADKVADILHLIQQLNLSKLFLLILSARDEALAGIKQSEAYKPLIAHTLDFRLLVLKTSDHVEWIEATTQAAGLFFEVNPNRQESLLDLLKHSIERHQCSLSAIQMVLFRLYENRDNSTLQYVSFHDLGGFEGILNHHFEDVFSAQPLAAKQVFIKLLPELIRYQSIVDQSVVNRRLNLNAAVEGLSVPLLDQLINQRLFHSEQLGELAIIKLNEPRMVHLWKRLSNWIAENQNSLTQRSELHFLTVRWLRNGQHASYLINQQQHAQMIELKQNELLVFDENEAQFLQASEMAVDQQKTTRAAVLACALLMLVVVVWLSISWHQEQTEHGLTQTHLSSLTQHLTTELNPQLKAKGQLDLLEGVSVALIRVFSSQDSTQLSAAELFNYVAALNVMGEISFNQRKYTEAHEYFASSVSGIEPIVNLSDNKLLQELMLSQYWLGYLEFIESKYGEARFHWNEYLQTALLLKSLMPGDPQWQLEHSYALNNLGSLSEQTGELQAAAEYFSQSIEIKTALLETQPYDMTLQADLADSLSWQGNIYRKQGALKQALAAYQHSADLTSLLKSDINKNNTKLHRETLAIHRMASVTFDLGQVNEALDLAKTAIEKSLLLNQLEPQNNSHKKELISLHLLNATIHRQLSDFDQSLSHIQKANQLIDHFKMNLKMTAQIAGYLMMVKREQALIFNHFGQTDSAITAINDGLSTWQAHDLKNQHLARITYVMLNLDWVQINKTILTDKAMLAESGVDLHLDQAWHEINSLQEQRVGDAQVMSITLNLLYEMTGEIGEHKFIQAVQQSEYRNPEYYQPLLDSQLITLN